MHELRKDPLLSRWVVVLGTSAAPSDYPIPSAGKCSAGGSCPLCKLEYEKDPSGGKKIRVVKGSPVLIPNMEMGRKGEGMYDRMNPVGLYEIILESDGHGPEPMELTASHYRDLLSVYRERITDNIENPKIRYVFVSKSKGIEAGALSEHPYSEVVSTPVIPKFIKDELDGAKQYYAYKERCIFCDIIAEELRFGSRIIAETRGFLAFCPYASREPFEFWVIPKAHNCAFESITPGASDDLAALLADVMGRMRRCLDDPPYYLFLHTAPNRIPRRNHWHTLGDDFHWHIEVLPRLDRQTAVEAGSDFRILPTSPEDAAKFIKEAC